MTIPTHKATVVIGDKSITLEGPRDFVEAQLALYLGKSSDSQVEKLQQPTSEGSQIPSFREFVESKGPKGHPEIVAVLAFGLANSGLTEFTEADMRRAYIRAGVRPPKVVSQALRDAKNLKDYIEPGRRRGTYRLSNHGDRTVRFDLPRK